MNDACGLRCCGAALKSCQSKINIISCANTVIVHALVSFSPVVKYVCKPSWLYVALIRVCSPLCLRPSSSRNISLSSLSNCIISDSTYSKRYFNLFTLLHLGRTCADTKTTFEPSVAAICLSFCNCELSEPWLRKSDSFTFAAYMHGLIVSKFKSATLASSS